MLLSSLALTLAAAVSAVAAYPISGDDVNCRSGPGTSYKVIKTYKKGTDVKLSCQAYGESINGNTLWDKTQDNCYVADYYVKTGSNGLVTKECAVKIGDGSAYQGKINRTEILARANYWIARKVPYSMSAYYPDPQGRKYRTDCSGFVSMALHAYAPGYNTVSLPEVAKSIKWSELKPGDFVGTLGAGTGGAAGHVTLFKSWADKDKKNYNTLECMGSRGCVANKRPVGWKVGSFTAKPYRYEKVID
ncbi:uncharacterized protein B0T15DRAFT_524137 [Chaetomium strumarium]|uniref:NlpC/P60 domain-containing protein n=1 Tax=Chaetomium strumarium TaxID=1170767 RepID=A0AAJ0GYY0_9PEZI|nr:hypothetical protein B0T15DRAFT_524137 [Chaetomium strumarium]